MRLIGALLLFAWICQPAAAATLQELLNKARTTEPAYMKARANLSVAQAKREQALGALLPQISITAGTNENARDYKTRNPQIPQVDDEYGSSYSTINLTQALINPASLYAFKQSSSVLRQAEHEMHAAEQTLILGLATTWLDWLAAIDSQRLADKKKLVAMRELMLVNRGHELGTYSQTELENFKARNAQAEAEQVFARASVDLKKSELERFVGEFEPMQIPKLNVDAEDPVQLKQTLPEILRELEQANPQLLAAQQSLLAASQEIKKQSAGHSPTLDVVVSHGKNSQDVGGFPGQSGYDITTTSSGLRFNLPIFSGGTQQGKVKEAIALREKASADFAGVLYKAKLEAKQAWHGLATARARKKASLLSKLSASSAYKQALRSAELGVNSELDVLKAEQNIISAENEFNKSNYDHWMAWLRLQASSGLLNEKDVTLLNSFAGY